MVRDFSEIVHASQVHPSDFGRGGRQHLRRPVRAWIAALILLACSVGSMGQDGGDAVAVSNPMGHFKNAYFENGTQFGIGPSDTIANILNFKPTWPATLGNWNIVNRLIVPVIWLEGQDIRVPPDVLEQAKLRGIEVGAGGELSLGGDDAFGMGDTTAQMFLARRRPGKLIWGIGPTLTMPTHTDPHLGTDNWSAGVGGMLLTAPGQWVFAGSVQNIWSFAGSDDREVNRFWFEYVLNYRLGNGWFLASSPTITANWEASSDDRWTVPLGGGIGRVIKSRDYPTTIKLEGFWNAEKPQFAADWSVQVALNFVFPKL